MHGALLKHAIVAGMLTGLGLGAAEAAATRPTSPDALGLGAATEPAAMCGYSCRSGGRYIPGPPGVCRANGLNFCGPSGGGWGGPGYPRRQFYAPTAVGGPTMEGLTGAALIPTERTGRP